MEMIKGFLIGFVTGGLLITIAVTTNIETTLAYKQGQIAAVSGDIRVELIEHPDKTKTWEWKKK